MSAELAKGNSVDKCADFWACGCVLYEMLRAKRAFPGEDVTDTLAAIVRAEPDWAALPSGTPPPIRTLLRRCLAKDPRERLPDIGAARLKLKDAVADRHEQGQPTAPPRRRAIVPWVLFAAASCVAAVALAYVFRARSEP